MSQRAAVSQRSVLDLQVKRREDIKVEARLNIILKFIDVWVA